MILFSVLQHTLKNRIKHTTHIHILMSDIPKISFNLEYRSTQDDAWYTSGVILDHHNQLLRVKFKEFPEIQHDEVFSVSDFSSSDDVDEFRRRFRAETVPVEDNECTKVIEGMTVCAAYTEDGICRYFDAIVDAVYYKEHTHEKCVCNYLLVWQHGPGENNISATKLEDIYIIMTYAVDPTVAEFIKLVKDKLRGASSQFSLIPKSSSFSKKSSSSGTFNMSQDFTNAGPSSHAGYFEGRKRFCPQFSDHDNDMGGVKGSSFHNYIILENLEKDLCPTLMVHFIREQTSLTGQAYVFPSLTMETYARGAIVADNISNLKRICDFISNPNHLIVSLSGRPWVIAEDMLRTRSFNLNSWSLQPRFENIYTRSELKVVRLGTEEYMRAKALKDLYMEFCNHLNGLAQRLDMEEKKRQPSITN